VVGNERLEIFPDVSTTQEQGIDSSAVPVQFRAIMGAPDMPEDAVQGYQDDLSKMVETEGWKSLATNDGLVTQNLQDKEFTDYMAQQREIVGTLLEDLGLRKDQ
jgi:putative tricarboxylic transport membrane protein